jgi:UDP-N-acetylglucosamine diphosphorylase / glucose-1-phosphate thymidylyltransferase / UDP-N-acetylgalactosamine diphosphorylase / glucosamine-1-phosphate N-acetyltransferase / galactosamine-1-phosphate N-acetyltransferase
MHASEFFSLEAYAHKALFVEGRPVWAALHEIFPYLEGHNPRKIEITIPSGVFLERPELISIGKGTVIEPGTYIQGPCIIGQGCILRHGALIREGTILGNQCVVGHGSEVKGSIFLNYAHATHLTYVGDSILGNWVNLGAGVKCANLRLDRKEVRVFIEGAKVKTGLKKMGAIIGDRSQIGCNCVLNPGTLFGKESISLPLVNISGSIPPRMQVSSSGTSPLQRRILEKIGK